MSAVDDRKPGGAPASTAASVVLERCDELATYTSLPGGLIERVYLSPQHAAVNSRTGQWMRAAGLTTWQDSAGNQCARLEGHRAGLPALLLASHLDTVPSAGRYDGILGVLIALAVAERINAGVAPADRPVALEVLAFGDEEGTRFGTTLLGSRAVAGTWDPDWWSLEDADGVTLHDAYLAFGLDPATVGDAARAPVELVGYLEAHIEQGPVLDEAGLPLGVVTSIAGARRFQIVVEGAAGHSGTPWARRRDALAGASEAVLAIERIARGEAGHSSGLIATVGHLAVFPDAVNVIAGRVEFSLDLRGEFDDARDAAWLGIKAAMTAMSERRGLRVTWQQTHSAPAAHCSERMRRVVAAGIRATERAGADPAAPPELFSMAGHDAMALAAVTEIGMLFVRCAGGVSHHPDESVTEADIARAVDALEASVLELFEQYRSEPGVEGTAS
ncbi:allantoate amidohydrolase [Cryobacterium frigoriphilum]|uniref:Allantoate amidohydrolase n=1 Tax=Cryobacterium frigoriphilum TaxID=1259150 RepID=A0A4R9A8K0_9MICO|nr:allantoate amidohydrolase [Cryobacterium frigoriphilum]TFD53924.1 allantoate amidohydrolase [Cryobacterium frigoriphilum]